ncbi:unnamed protein product [Brassicogethes aeneus]|uniref:NAD(+) kinase n=1 Tax=Brassicogethes aeneus TaxID=1431903 RepID=A0A9P0AXR8_BRAAE|nr:unnamed protein product [Brassicogethes aeneus]
MFKHNRTFKNIYLGYEFVKNNDLFRSRCNLKTFTRDYSAKLTSFNNVLVVSKLSRYEYEQRRHQDLSSQELEKLLRNRGTDYEKLVKFHDLHKRFEENVVTTLENMGICVTVCNRFSFCEDLVNQADVIMPVGGDGTFLLASSLIKDNKKPVIGFNSDPNRSEGHLCLPKKYSTNIREAIEKLQKGNFKWLMRNRIRTTMLNKDEILTPKYLHEIENESITIEECSRFFGEGSYKVLPVLALNEVFIGETLSARVSHLHMRLNNNINTTNLKCSGLCVSTGTGSTSWHLSINRLPTQTVAELLRLIDVETTENKDNLAATLSDIYNKNLIFNPDDKRLGYTIRDLVSAGVWPQPKGIQSRGFATRIEVRSFCYEASLVIDGGVSFSFNDGTVAVLEICPDDSLRTVILSE